MQIEYDQAVKHKEEGNRVYQAGKYEQAITHYNRAIQSNPNDPIFYLNRARCHFNLDRYEKCVMDCNRSLGLSPLMAKALNKKATALVQMLRFAEAVEAQKNAIAAEKTQALTNELQEMESLKSNYDRVVEYFRANNYSDALGCINYLANKIPKSRELKIKRIECLAKTGDLDEAIKALSTVQGEQDSEFFYLKGILAQYRGDKVAAERAFQDALRISPMHSKSQLAQLNWKKCETLKEEGNELLKQNKYNEAAAKYTQALQLDPFNRKLNSILYSNRALTHMKRKQNNQALQDLTRSLQLDPNYTNSLVRRAEIYMEKQNYSGAIADYGKIQELDPRANYSSKIEEAKKKERQAKKKDYYAVLGLEKGASDADIKKAYKTLAMKYHPDRNRNKSSVEQDDASKKFKEIAEAHGVLSDPQKKKQYDCGGMQFDGDMGAGFNMGGMGGNHTFTFSSSGGQIDPEIMKKMFGGFGGMDFGFTNMGGMGSQSRSRSPFGGKSPSSIFDSFGMFGNMPNFGGMNDMNSHFQQRSQNRK